MKPLKVLDAIVILAGATIVAACASTPETPAQEFTGTMSSGCAPHDAPSTVLDLKASSGEATVSFNLWPSGGIVPPATAEFDAERPLGQATFCNSAGTCTPATRGRVSVESDESGVRGEWSIGLADGSSYKGTFRAQWLAIQALCG